MNIGIDLGTTNSALAFIDPKDAVETDFPAIRVLDVPQFIAPGRVETRRTLPSFLYLGDQEYVGAYAREQGALVPTKCVHSAKSWLSNPAVDRTAKILPWDAQEAGREAPGRCVGKRAWIPVGRAQRRPHRSGEFR
jgi:molecular chaperone DnaK (HSP70)